MPDVSYVGRAIPVEEPYLVGREKIREFASAVGEQSPICHDVAAARAAGYADLVAPPTFTAAFVMPAIEAFLADPEFGWDYAHMVHGDQSNVLHRPIVGGDELRTVIHVDDLSTRAGSNLLTLRCEVADATGEPVVTTRLLLVTAASA